MEKELKELEEIIDRLAKSSESMRNKLPPHFLNDISRIIELIAIMLEKMRDVAKAQMERENGRSEP